MLERGGVQSVSLHFDEPVLNTTFLLADGDICGVQSPFLPQWSASLTHMGITETMLETARMGAETPHELIRNLLQAGHLTESRLTDLLRLRVEMALVPIVLQPAQIHVKPQVSVPWIAHVDGRVALQMAELSARQLEDDALSIKPTDLLEVAPYLAPESTVAAQALHQGALAGLPLLESARRAHLRWDDVARGAASLIQRGWRALHRLTTRL
ncbi:hypothetical protein [Deinococcus multiflagellatus]|uniref:Uncharacterized protein n=1 Tax=Deinococcus multiflagellatus TaxID=1656887 RepID=A0ABW1ZQX9_9DEIO